MRSIILIAIVCLSCACTNYSNKKGTESTVKWANIKDVNVQDVFDLENSTFISLDTNQEAILSGNLKISVLDDEIFILDYSMNQVFRFGKNGQFKNKIGKMGSGPEEYIQPCDIHIDQINKQIEILGEPMSTVKKYSYEGDFISKLHFNFHSQAFIKTPDQNYYFYRGLNNASDPYRITMTDSTKIIVSFLKDIGNPGVGHISSPNSFAYNRNNIFLMENLLPTILQLNNERIENFLSIDYGMQTLNEKDISQFSSIMDFFKHITAQGFYNIEEIVATEEYLIFKIIYQKENEDLMFHHVFYNLNDGKLEAKIKTKEAPKIFMGLAKMHNHNNNHLVFSLPAYDIVHHNILDSFPSKFISLSKIDESDNPVLFLLKLNLQ